MYLRIICEETGVKVDPPLIFKEDNKSRISLSKDHGEHKRIKHIDNRHFFVRYQVIDDEAQLDHVPSKHQLAEIFTKLSD